MRLADWFFGFLYTTILVCGCVTVSPLPTALYENPFFNRLAEAACQGHESRCKRGIEDLIISKGVDRFARSDHRHGDNSHGYESVKVPYRLGNDLRLVRDERSGSDHYKKVVVDSSSGRDTTGDTSRFNDPYGLLSKVDLSDEIRNYIISENLCKITSGLFGANKDQNARKDERGDNTKVVANLLVHNLPPDDTTEVSETYSHSKRMTDERESERESKRQNEIKRNPDQHNNEPNDDHHQSDVIYTYDYYPDEEQVHNDYAMSTNDDYTTKPVTSNFHHLDLPEYCSVSRDKNNCFQVTINLSNKQNCNEKLLEHQASKQQSAQNINDIRIRIKQEFPSTEVVEEKWKSSPEIKVVVKPPENETIVKNARKNEETLRTIAEIRNEIKDYVGVALSILKRLDETDDVYSIRDDIKEYDRFPRSIRSADDDATGVVRRKRSDDSFTQRGKPYSRKKDPVKDRGSENRRYNLLESINNREPKKANPKNVYFPKFEDSYDDDDDDEYDDDDYEDDEYDYDGYYDFDDEDEVDEDDEYGYYDYDEEEEDELDENDEKVDDDLDETDDKKSVNLNGFNQMIRMAVNKGFQHGINTAMKQYNQNQVLQPQTATNVPDAHIKQHLKSPLRVDLYEYPNKEKREYDDSENQAKMNTTGEFQVNTRNVLSSIFSSIINNTLPFEETTVPDSGDLNSPIDLVELFSLKTPNKSDVDDKQTVAALEGKPIATDTSTVETPVTVSPIVSTNDNLQVNAISSDESTSTPPTLPNEPDELGFSFGLSCDNPNIDPGTQLPDCWWGHDKSFNEILNNMDKNVGNNDTTRPQSQADSSKSLIQEIVHIKKLPNSVDSLTRIPDLSDFDDSAKYNKVIVDKIVTNPGDESAIYRSSSFSDLWLDKNTMQRDPDVWGPFDRRIRRAVIMRRGVKLVPPNSYIKKIPYREKVM